MKYKKFFPFTINGIQYTDEEVQNSEELQLKAIEEDEYAMLKYINKPNQKKFN